MKKDKLLILLTFMYIFAFRIYSVIDSAVIVGFILTVFIIVNKEYRNYIIKTIKNRNVFRLVICMIVLTIWSIIVLIINQSLDYTYIKTLIHLYITIAIGYELIGYFKYKNRKTELVNYIIISFIIQSILQWVFFIFPDFSKLFNIFRTESMIFNNIKYSGYRGIAIASSGFFALSSAYGLAAILYITKYNTLFQNKVLKILMFLLMYSGTFFAGRTGFVALPFVLFIVVFKLIKRRKEIISKLNKKNILIIISFMLAVCLTMSIIYAITSKNEKFSKMYSYAFELVNNIFSGKGVTTSSTDKLIKMYDRNFSIKTLIVGDGKYTVENEGIKAYYMNTDVGYYRKVFYFGIIGTILSFILQMVLLNKNDIEKIAIFIFLMLLEFKGEVIGINIMINSIIVLYSNLSEITKERDEK